MKLIIDISEDLYQTFHNTQPRMGDAGIDSICQAIGNGIPLDKIRAKILRYRDTIDRAIAEDSSKIEGMKEAYNDCLEVIDKYKGE